MCPACNKVHYENPLPVAASVVLNPRREVLLVLRAREPQKGQWCLPMGFAEVHETIGQAALRELAEETGVEGRVLRLLDADSYPSGHYGDLLIVTFEIEKTGGVEQPGDDAADVRYFPIGQHPPLAFHSNEKALRVCVAAHMEDWEIQDSFVTLEAEQDKSMLSDALVELIQQNARQIAAEWLEDVRSSPTTRSYCRIDPQQLLERAAAAISQFGRWFKGDEAAEGVRAFYRTLAREREAQGFELSELLSSLMLLKKHVWSFAQQQGPWKRPIDVYRVLELSRLMATFFDRAMYHEARGFGFTSGDTADAEATDDIP